MMKATNSSADSTAAGRVSSRAAGTPRPRSRAPAARGRPWARRLREQLVGADGADALGRVGQLEDARDRSRRRRRAAARRDRPRRPTSAMRIHPRSVAESTLSDGGRARRAVGRVPAVNDRLVWIDCEMTGLDLGADALIEVAALVTDFDLNVLGDGVDVVIKPPAGGARPDGRLRARRCTRRPGCSRSSTPASPSRRPSSRCSPTSRSTAPTAAARRWPATPSPPTARSWPATCRTLEAFLHYRIVDVSSIKELSRRWYPRAYFDAPAKRGNHRALADIQESIEELRYYRAAVFVPPPGPDSDDARRHWPRSTAASLTGRAADPTIRLRTGTLIAASASPAVSARSRHDCRGSHLVGVAQLVERRVVVADVAGSSPVVHPRQHRQHQRALAAGGRPLPCR